MNKKVILISVDGMRPDGLKMCGNSYVPAASLLDIAPTIAAVMGIAPDREWEGRSLLNR